MNTFHNESAEDILHQNSSNPSLLFVDDDQDVQAAARLLFRRRGIKMLSAYDTQEALTQLAIHSFDLVLLDLNYSKGATNGAEGLALLKDILILRPDLPVVVVTGHSGVTIAVEAMRAGACDFVMKPWNNDRLGNLVDKILDGRKSETMAESESILIIASPDMKRIVAEADRLAPTRAPLIICGPSGSGKTVLAQRIHALSRNTGPIRMIYAEECNRLPEGGGTWIFRDVEALAPSLQRQLADRLDGGEAVRVIALTSQDRKTLEAQLEPRLMLLLGMVTLVIPPLNERPDDIPALAMHFLRYFASRHGLPEPVMEPRHLAALQAGLWPQNVRSLRATIERAVLMGTWETPSESPNASGDGTPTLRDAERSLIETALRNHSFNVTKAARELGLTRPALYRRMARYGL
ncbi:two component, sigma54 specific, fis family transcriptional regulator [Acetobacter senegalensis]|uniref:Two component, sigma54 specific, fis family transcriptional regulator n=1 Tax=Acetobacter senegalensis TaxID=446692 RepID=A0A0U5FSF3_9PROT|nr:response regulator [Acetobacter senegalensis]CEF42717.1 two component, sigma54 specific, fis family transcriptional regulator [Acetobacter senegalensis]